MARVGLFDPCYLLALRPQEADHARRILAALGDEAEVIDGVCCGQPAFNSGFRNEARSVGREFLRAARAFDVVAALSGSCTSMVTHYLPSLFDDGRREGAERIAGRVVEFSAYLTSHPALDQLALRLDGTIAYHDACHARRELGLTTTVAGLLGRIDGLEVRRLAFEDECCGFGGTFSRKLPEVAGAMVEAKLADIDARGAQVLVSTDVSCLTHIEGAARARGQAIETWSLTELLARALG